MELNISIIDILKILAVIVLLIALLMPKKNGYEYNSIDKKGVTLNIILSVIYIPLSLIGMFTVFFADAPTTNYSDLKKLLLNIVIYIGLSIPIISIASIFTSVVARKRGKNRFSFVIQFLPIPAFVAMIILVFFMLRA